MFKSLLVIVSIAFSVEADVAHFFAPEFGGFLQHHLPPVVLQQHHHHQQFPFGSTAESYGPPPVQGYPSNPNPTPAPVAPTQPSTTTEFSLPEVIDNRSAKTGSQFIPLSQQYLPPDIDRPNYESPAQPPEAGYYYPRPNPTTTPASAIVVQEPLEPESPGYDYNAPAQAPLRPSMPAPVYLPPANETPNEDTAVTPPLRLRVQEMRCLQHADGYFRAVLKVNSFLGSAPIVDNDSFDKHCELQLKRSYVVADIAAADFQQCGVRTCGKDLCLRVRFPQIRGMRTSTDAILTLHCKTQERVAVKTHALKMGVANDVQARSGGSLAHGGSQNQFRTHVELLRKASNGFTRHLDSSQAVQLGEELLLRAHVLAGDGWNYTKLTDVSLQRIAASGELVNAANLINARGCLNPAMQSICAHAPQHDPPLGYRLAFKAIMFQGMRSGEELMLTMRITGCLDPHDCHVNAGDCNGGDGGNEVRRRRDVRKQTPLNDSEISEVSRIAFRVVLPTNEGEDNVKSWESNANGDNNVIVEEETLEQVTTSRNLVLIGSVGFVALLVGLGLISIIKLKQ